MFREKKAEETFQAGLQYLPFFLAEAMADEDLIAYLRMNKLDIIRAKELPRGQDEAGKGCRRLPQGT